MTIMNGIYQGFRQINNNVESGINRQQQENGKSVTGGNNNPYQQYQQNMVNTATPQELTLMLYNGLVRFLKQAAQSVEEKNIEKVSNYIIRAQDIITEFMCTLDMHYEVSQNLFSLYDYMKSRLVEANIKKDKAILEEIIGYAEELRDTWAQAMKIAKQQQQVVNK